MKRARSKVNISIKEIAFYPLHSSRRSAQPSVLESTANRCLLRRLGSPSSPCLVWKFIFHLFIQTNKQKETKKKNESKLRQRSSSSDQSICWTLQFNGVDQPRTPVTKDLKREKLWKPSLPLLIRCRFPRLILNLDLWMAEGYLMKRCLGERKKFQQKSGTFSAAALFILPSITVFLGGKRT